MVALSCGTLRAPVPPVEVGQNLVLEAWSGWALEVEALELNGTRLRPQMA